MISLRSVVEVVSPENCPSCHSLASKRKRLKQGIDSKVVSDTSVDVPSDLPASELVEYTLDKLELQHLEQTAVVRIQVNNWTPLEIDQISEDPSVSTGDLLKDISNNVTLRIMAKRPTSVKDCVPDSNEEHERPSLLSPHLMDAAKDAFLRAAALSHNSLVNGDSEDLARQFFQSKLNSLSPKKQAHDTNDSSAPFTPPQNEAENSDSENDHNPTTSKDDTPSTKEYSGSKGVISQLDASPDLPSHFLKGGNDNSVLTRFLAWCNTQSSLPKDVPTPTPAFELPPSRDVPQLSSPDSNKHSELSPTVSGSSHGEAATKEPSSSSSSSTGSAVPMPGNGGSTFNAQFEVPILERWFAACCKPSPADVRQMAQTLNASSYRKLTGVKATPAGVAQWFEARRGSQNGPPGLDYSPPTSAPAAMGTKSPELDTGHLRFRFTNSGSTGQEPLSDRKSDGGFDTLAHGCGGMGSPPGQLNRLKRKLPYDSPLFPSEGLQGEEGVQSESSNDDAAMNLSVRQDKMDRTRPHSTGPSISQLQSDTANATSHMSKDPNCSPKNPKHLTPALHGMLPLQNFVVGKTGGVSIMNSHKSRTVANFSNVDPKYNHYNTGDNPHDEHRTNDNESENHDGSDAKNTSLSQLFAEFSSQGLSHADGVPKLGDSGFKFESGEQKATNSPPHNGFTPSTNFHSQRENGSTRESDRSTEEHRPESSLSTTQLSPVVQKDLLLQLAAAAASGNGLTARQGNPEAAAFAFASHKLQEQQHHQQQQQQQHQHQQLLSLEQLFSPGSLSLASAALVLQQNANMKAARAAAGASESGVDAELAALSALARSAQQPLVGPNGAKFGAFPNLGPSLLTPAALRQHMAAQQGGPNFASSFHPGFPHAGGVRGSPEQCSPFAALNAGKPSPSTPATSGQPSIRVVNGSHTSAGNSGNIPENTYTVPSFSAKQSRRYSSSKVHYALKASGRPSFGVLSNEPDARTGASLKHRTIKAQASGHRTRLMFDPLSEIPLLEKWFEDNPHPSWLQIDQFTETLNSLPYRSTYPPVTTYNVKIWFKNRRAKNKRLTSVKLEEDTGGANGAGNPSRHFALNNDVLQSAGLM